MNFDPSVIVWPPWGMQWAEDPPYGHSLSPITLWPLAYIHPVTTLHPPHDHSSFGHKIFQRDVAVEWFYYSRGDATIIIKSLYYNYFYNCSHQALTQPLLFLQAVYSTTASMWCMKIALSRRRRETIKSKSRAQFPSLLQKRHVGSWYYYVHWIFEFGSSALDDAKLLHMWVRTPLKRASLVLVWAHRLRRNRFFAFAQLLFLAFTCESR